MRKHCMEKDLKQYVLFSNWKNNNMFYNNILREEIESKWEYTRHSVVVFYNV
jgi:hypothetical protein